MNSPFIIYALPRSRTFWLSKFLSYGDWICGHDELRHLRTLENAKTWLNAPCTGTAETAAAPWWRLAQMIKPDARVVTIRRDPAGVLGSLLRTGIAFDQGALKAMLAAMDRKLDQIEARIPGVLSVQFDDLTKEEICAKVFEHCLPYKHDPEWWVLMNSQNLQCDLRSYIHECQTFAPQLEKVGRAAKQMILRDMTKGAPPDKDGITIQTEKFDDWFRDAAPLFRDHMVATGQDIEDYNKKNLPAFRGIEQLGMLQIVTARSNGRMFGYLVTVLSPSLDDPDLLSALHLPFYASPDIPGLGMRMQRAALDLLRGRGAGELFGRAGIRGSGPRLGAVYKRLGGEEIGQLYRIPLKEFA